MHSKFKLQIRAELRDPQGKLIKRLPWSPANSLLKQFIQCLTVQMSQAAQTILDTSNASHSCGIDSYNLKSNGAAASTVLGILIGSGITPVTMTDYKLQTQIITNVVHGACTFAVENPDASTWRLNISRTFTNNTGASLGIREVALYCNMTLNYWVICIDRTLYSVDVPNGVTVTLTYLITVSL